MIHAQKSITLVTQVEYGGHLVCMSGARANPLPAWLCTEDHTKHPPLCSTPGTILKVRQCAHSRVRPLSTLGNANLDHQRKHVDAGKLLTMR